MAAELRSRNSKAKTNKIDGISKKRERGSSSVGSYIAVALVMSQDEQTIKKLNNRREAVSLTNSLHAETKLVSKLRLSPANRTIYIHTSRQHKVSKHVGSSNSHEPKDGSGGEGGEG